MSTVTTRVAHLKRTLTSEASSSININNKNTGNQRIWYYRHLVSQCGLELVQPKCNFQIYYIVITTLFSQH